MALLLLWSLWPCGLRWSAIWPGGVTPSNRCGHRKVARFCWDVVAAVIRDGISYSAGRSDVVLHFLQLESIGSALSICTAKPLVKAFWNLTCMHSALFYERWQALNARSPPRGLVFYWYPGDVGSCYQVNQKSDIVDRLYSDVFCSLVNKIFPLNLNISRNNFRFLLVHLLSRHLKTYLKRHLCPNLIAWLWIEITHIHNVGTKKHK